MPQIKEYLPETQSQGAVGGNTPNLEAVSLFGRSLENVGASFNYLSDVLHRREAQKEVSDIYGKFAQARAEWNVKLKERLNNGTLDPDQFDQEYADYVNKMGDSVKTAEGKDFFNRQANRLGGTLLQNAMIGKARIAGEQAYADISSGINLHVANLKANPDQLQDAIGSTEELIAAKQKDGALTPEQAIRIKRELLPQLVESSVKGLADQDQGINPETGQPYENLGKQFLDQGHFAELMNENLRSSLYAYSRAAEERKISDKERAETTAHRMLQAKGLEYMDSVSNRIMNGTYSLKELDTAPLTLEQKIYVKHQVDSINKAESVTDKRVYNNVFKQILSGEITSREEIRAGIVGGKYKIAPQDLPFLEKMIDSTPDGLAIKQAASKIDKAIDRQFNIKGVGGVPLAGAQALAADTRKDLADTMTLWQGQNPGVSPRQFWTNADTKDPLSPYAVLARHQVSMPDLMNMQVNAIKGTYSAPTQDPNIVRYSNSPTKEIPRVYGPQPPPPEEAPAEVQPQAPQPEKPKELNWWEPHPNDTPEMAATRAQNAATRQSAIDALSALKESPITKGLAESLGSTIKVLNSPKAQPKKVQPADQLWRPGESIEDYNKRVGIKN